MLPPRFDDLLDIRVADGDLAMGMCPSRIGRITSVEQWQTKAAALRALMHLTLGRQPDDLECEPDVATLSEERRDGYVERRIEYNVEPDERIAAYVLLPARRDGRAPGMLCIHPTTPLGKDQTVGRQDDDAGRDRAYAVHLVRRGYVTLAYDLMGAGERRFPGVREFDTAAFYRRRPHWSAVGKDLWDARRALDVLGSLAEVDGERLGSIGHSQGAGITIYLAALDARVQAGVASCGMCPKRLSKNPFNVCRSGWWVGQPLLRPFALTGKDFPVDLHEDLALAAPRGMFISQALNDYKYTLDEQDVVRAAFEDLLANVRKVYELFGVPKRLDYRLHTDGHGFPAHQHEPAYRFLDGLLQPRR